MALPYHLLGFMEVWYMVRSIIYSITSVADKRCFSIFLRWQRDRWEPSPLPLNTSETPSWSEEQREQPTVFQHIWRSETKDRGHWKIRLYEECLRTIRSLGPGQGTRRLKPWLQDAWERPRLGCVSSQVLVWTRGAWIGRISQKEKENRGT